MRNFCLPQRLSMLTLGIIFTILGLGTVVVGITILPVIGLIFAVPLFCIAYYFYHTHLTGHCDIPDRP